MSYSGNYKRKLNKTNSPNKLIKIENEDIKIKNLSDFDLKSFSIKLERVDIEKYKKEIIKKSSTTIKNEQITSELILKSEIINEDYNESDNESDIALENRIKIQNSNKISIKSEGNNSHEVQEISESEDSEIYTETTESLPEIDPILVPEVQILELDNGKIVYYKILYLCTICCLYHCNELTCKSTNEHLHDNCNINVLKTIYECIRCKCKFTGIEFLKLHICKTQNDNQIEIKQWLCNVGRCRGKFNCYKDFIIHSSILHKNESLLLQARTLYQCEKCFQVSNTSDEMKKHENTICTSTCIPHSKCNEYCYNKNSKKSDIVEIRTENVDIMNVKNCKISTEIYNEYVSTDTILFCYFCNLVIYKCLATSHIKQHNKSINKLVELLNLKYVNKKLLKCKVCKDNVYFRTEELLFKHIYLVHDTITESEFNGIEQEFQKYTTMAPDLTYVKYEPKLTIDELMKENVVGVHYNCPVCNMGYFKDVPQAVGHIKMYHEEELGTLSNELDFGVYRTETYKHFCKKCKVSVENVERHLEWHNKAIYLAVS